MSRRYQHAHPCPTPSKLSYPSIEAAAESFARNSDATDPTRADWAYRCQCGKWHRTKSHRPHLGGIDLRTVQLSPEALERLARPEAVG